VSSDVLVVLPTFNELPNLEKVVAGVRRLGHHVLVVDDASPDGTGELADRLAAADPAVRVLHRPSKLGLGSAYEDAFQLGLAGDTQLFVEMDADGSHLAGNLDSIIAAARSSGGLAIGSRYIQGGSVVGWPFYRWLLSWGANVYCRILLWLPTHDCTSGFRCYTRNLLTQIGLDSVVSQGYSFQIEMVHRTRRLGFAVVEVPIRFEDRVAGASKVSQGEVRRALWTVLRLSLGRWKR
jgi:dolichol-phosphate mannosyltransferase